MLSSRTLLLVGHIAAAVVFVGPFTVASSAFPRQIKLAAENQAAVAVARELNRISRVYGTNSLAVPVLGLALAAQGDWWSQRWLQVAVVLTVVWTGLFFVTIVLLQHRAVEAVETAQVVDDRVISRLHMFTGMHALLWVATLWLMVAKPW